MAARSNFILTPQQQELLFAALNTNRPAAPPNTLTMSPASLHTSPATSKLADFSPPDAFQDSSFLDYDYSFDGADSSMDLSLNNGAQLALADGLGSGSPNDELKTESAPSLADNDSPDKRGHPDDEEDEDATATKRRDAGEKVPKKPGRKPLTSEPSSKRKAQNRAAQRAFRERKEKHVKDLETKVAELEKASEAANNENGLLRAQVEKMTVELSEYKKRLSIVSSTTRPQYPVAGAPPFGNPIFNNINDVNFQFEFPKFGTLPGPSAKSASGNGSTPGSLHRVSSVDTAVSPANDMTASTTAATSSLNSPQDSSMEGLKKTNTREDLSKLSSVFSPPLTNSNIQNASRTSLDSTSSPSTSSNSNTAPSSSCGTSPEPCNQSPLGFKPVDTMTTIGEEPHTMTSGSNATQDVTHFANVDINDMGWLGSQNGFRFDPQLFGDYREPQDNILASGGFDDSFFNDALDVDFTTPFNTAPSPVLQKSNLIAQIDAAKEGEFASSSINTNANTNAPTKGMPPIPSASCGALLTCNRIWEKLQNCPKVQNGDFDLDGLCSDLQKKAKCSGSGAVVNENDFKLVMNKYLGSDADGDCAKDLLCGTNMDA